MSTTSVIWDRPTRLIHWFIASGILLNLFVIEEGDPPHRWIGYGVTVFMLLRLVWGFFGAPASRFANWPLGFSYLKQFVSDQKHGFHRDYPGHNPAACLTYVFIWLAILGLAVTGWMMGLDTFWGEEWLEDLHGAISTGLEVLVVIHLLGLSFDSWKFRRKTWLGMITGRRSTLPKPPDHSVHQTSVH